MRADDPRHGSVAGYGKHQTDGEYPCLPCRAAKSEYNNEVRRLRAYGRWEPFVDAEPVKQHIRALMDEGMSIKRIADAAGTRPSRISILIYGRSSQAAPRRMRRETAAAILAVSSDPWKVDSLGARRRLRALARLGYNQRLLARHIGTTQGMVWEIMHESKRRLRITAENNERIDRVFRELCMSLPPETTPGERRAVSRTRRLAEREGWLPPLAYDNIDDPDEQPATPTEVTHRTDIDEAVVLRTLNGERIPSTRAEKDEAMRRWVISGLGSRANLCNLVGWKEGRYWPVRFAVTTSGTVHDIGANGTAVVWPHERRRAAA